MIRTIKCTCLLLLAAVQVYAYTERNLLQQAAGLQQVKQALVLAQKWIPYPAYQDRAGWDTFLGESKAYFVRRGEQQLSYVWKVIPATAYLEFERSGNRRIMEDPFGSNNQAIADLLMAELAEGKGRFIDQLANGVFYSCEMSSWALSAHLGREQVSHHSLPDNQKHVIDLTAGDLGSMLAWVYYYLHEEFDKLNPVISGRLRSELQARVLDTFANDHSFWWMAFDYTPGMLVNNWNPWCNFNVLQCLFLLENNPDKLAEGVYNTMVSVDKFINYTHSDGACEEGPSYWGHAAGKMYDYLQMLFDGTGGKISIFNQPIIRNMGEYIARSYVGNGWVVNFADASAKGGGNAPLIFRYGKAVGSQVMQQYAAYLDNLSGRGIQNEGRDIFRTLQDVMCRNELSATPPAYQSPAYTWYPETEFCYMGNKEGFFLAAKGGFNDESHNHNDVGTFSLYLNTTPVFIDAGVGTYTRQTFDTGRYAIWTMQSNFHNLPLINGYAQSPGKEYGATHTAFHPAKKLFSTNIAAAYPAAAEVKRWIRSYTLDKNTVKVEDSFTLGKAIKPNQVNFLTWGKVNLSTPGEITIEVDGTKVRLSYDKKKFTASIGTVALDDPRLSNVWGKEVYRISLDAVDMQLSGTYKYVITQIK